MALPNPLPDNPLRWDGWRSYNSEDPYTRLCLSFDSNPTTEQIEDNCRQLLVWWQKKLPLKNQPSNPIAQLLRSGMDEAPQMLAEARTRLTDPISRAEVDQVVRERIVQEAVEEFKKILPFSISHHEMTWEAEQRLYEGGERLGLLREEIERILVSELARLKVTRLGPPVAPPPPPPPPPQTTSAFEAGDPFGEFRRVLKLSKLCLDGEEMTDDQRDALCNMGESLGLTGGQAEDVIDEYLEEMSGLPPAPLAPVKPPAGRGGAAVLERTAAAPPKRAPVPVRPTPVPVAEKIVAPPKRPEVIIHTSPMARLQEKAKYPNFKNRYGLEMMLVTSGDFLMGSDAPEASANEQPLLPTTVSCFFISRFPVTNEQYEQYDAAHATRRAPWADGRHPVVYVNTKDAEAYCAWLSARDGHKYRLPTEAEWEYAARGTDTRNYPWGDRLDAGHYANLADVRTKFPWSDPRIDDGFAESAPVGSFPRGASPFGAEDMAGNVYEWCLDFFEPYRATTNSRKNPRGPMNGTRRVYRGGSWKSRAASLRTSARAFNLADYSSNDVGFRIVCECEAD